jgi:hypothetical protein
MFSLTTHLTLLPPAHAHLPQFVLKAAHNSHQLVHVACDHSRPSPIAGRCSASRSAALHSRCCREWCSIRVLCQRSASGKVEAPCAQTSTETESEEEDRESRLLEHSEVDLLLSRAHTASAPGMYARSRVGRAARLTTAMPPHKHRASTAAAAPPALLLPIPLPATSRGLL